MNIESVFVTKLFNIIFLLTNLHRIVHSLSIVYKYKGYFDLDKVETNTKRKKVKYRVEKREVKNKAKKKLNEIVS